MYLSLSTLLAETRVAEVSLQYREDVALGGISGFWYLLIPVAAIAIAITSYKIATRRPAIINTRHGMLHELCRAHGINASARALLERIAEEAELGQPAQMLLGLTQFEAAVEKASLHIDFDRRQTSTLGMLRRRLFA